MSVKIVTTYLPTAYRMQEYAVTLQAESVPERAVVWSVNEETPLPYGLMLNAENGEISGIPQRVQRTSVHIYATVEEPHEQTYKILNLFVYEGSSQPLKITVDGKVSCSVSTEFDLALTAEGGTPPYRWSCDSLPIALELKGDRVTGRVHISGGSMPVIVTVTDARNNSESKTIYFQISK